MQTRWLISLETLLLRLLMQYLCGRNGQLCHGVAKDTLPCVQKRFGLWLDNDCNFLPKPQKEWERAQPKCLPNLNTALSDKTGDCLVKRFLHPLQCAWNDFPPLHLSKKGPALLNYYIGTVYCYLTRTKKIQTNRLKRRIQIDQERNGTIEDNAKDAQNDTKKPYTRSATCSLQQNGNTGEGNCPTRTEQTVWTFLCAVNIPIFATNYTQRPRPRRFITKHELSSIICNNYYNKRIWAVVIIIERYKPFIVISTR